MKKILCITLLFGFALSILMFGKTVKAQQVVEQGSCGESATYTVDSDGLMIISGTGKVTKTSPNFPVNKVIVNEGIIELCNKAFMKSGAKEVELADSIKKIGECSFVNCKSLTKVKLPKTLKDIPYGLFMYSDGVNEIIWPENCVSIGPGFMYENKSMKTITVPDSVKSIGYDFFTYSTALKTIILGKGVKEVDSEFAYQIMTLRKIVNHSKIRISLPSGCGNKLWYVNGKRVEELNKGKTAVMKPKTFKIKYKLNGGKVKIKLPQKHTYTKVTYLPPAKRKGYTFLGWEVHSWPMYETFTDKIKANAYEQKKKSILVYAYFKKYKVYSKDGCIHVMVKDSTYGTKKYKKKEDSYCFRYANNKEMKHAHEVKGTDLFRKVHSKKLVTGTTYYVEIAKMEGSYMEDEPFYRPYGNWTCKRKVVIK